MANMRGDLALQVSVDDRRCESRTTYSWAGGGMVLTISTVLPDRGLAVELISTYVGRPQTSTVVTHLVLGPLGRTPAVHFAEHEHERLDPVESVRECGYDHMHQLIDALRTSGHGVSVELDEQTFAELERVE